MVFTLKRKYGGYSGTKYKGISRAGYYKIML
jgi:hypothetical protein